MNKFKKIFYITLLSLIFFILNPFISYGKEISWLVIQFPLHIPALTLMEYIFLLLF